MPQMAMSQHANYHAANTQHLADEQSAIDNTMQQILNQSQITASADGAPPGVVLLDNNGLNVSMHNRPTSTSYLLHSQNQPQGRPLHYVRTTNGFNYLNHSFQSASPA